MRTHALLAVAVLIGWGLGLIVCAIPVCAGWASLWSLQRHAENATGHPALPHIKRLTRHLRIRRRVQLYLGPQTLMPMVWGIFKIRLALPQGVDKWNEERLRLVLLHELAHAKRHDFLSHALTQLVCALYWFNPLVWWAAHRMTLDREHACDDLVLMQGSDPGDYAGELLQVVAELNPSPRLGSAAVAMARSSKLEARIRSILDESIRRRMTGICLTVCTLVVLAHVQPGRRAADIRTAVAADAGPGRALSGVKRGVRGARRRQW